jgi:hypothetical protein
MSVGGVAQVVSAGGVVGLVLSFHWQVDGQVAWVRNCMHVSTLVSVAAVVPGAGVDPSAATVGGIMHHPAGSVTGGKTGAYLVSHLHSVFKMHSAELDLTMHGSAVGIVPALAVEPATGAFIHTHTPGACGGVVGGLTSPGQV